MYSIDIDIGGTFTDGFFTDGTQIQTRKVLTTPHDISECFMNCVRAGSEAFSLDLESFLLKTDVARVSTTVGTNLLVQCNGPRIGLIVSEGAERNLYGKGDAGIIGRYVQENMVLGVPEEVDDTGRVVKEVDKEMLLAAVRGLVQNGARMVVVSFRNAWRNAANERLTREIMKERYPVHYLRSIPMQIGTDVAHVSDDHARTNSALLNAYVHGEMARRLYRAEDQLRAAGYRKPLLVVHANGGNARVAKTVALNTLHSGPAAAVRGAVFLANLLDLKRVVTADMGGTSLDISVVVDKKLPMSDTSHAGGAEIAIPMIELDAVGAGGGSLATAKDGELRVGPESAGSAPGPVCYGKGGMEPTVTDANVLLGYIDPDYFLGGKIKLDAEGARRAVSRRIGRPLKIEVEEACVRIRDIVNNNIAGEIKARLGAVVPAEVSLFAFGGCGPLHACAIADAVGFRRIIAFPFASVFSAFGSSTTDIRHTYAKTFGVKADRAADVHATLGSFREQAALDMAGEGFPVENAVLAAELRVVNGGKSTTHALDPAASAGDISSLIGSGVLDSLRFAAECPVPHWTPTAEKERVTGAPPVKATRKVQWDQTGAIDTPIYDALAFRHGHSVAGPSIVEAPDTSVVVGPGWNLTTDAYRNFILERR